MESCLRLVGQDELRKTLLDVLKNVFLPKVKGLSVLTGRVEGHDEEVENVVGVIEDVSLLEEYESDVLLTLRIEGYGTADVCLEELRESKDIARLLSAVAKLQSE